jgi:hypothetical protein
MSAGLQGSRRLGSFFLVLVAWAGLGFVDSEARADRITLHQGQPLKGKLIVDKNNPGQYLLIGEVGKTPMVIRKDQVVSVTPEKSPLDDYVVFLEKERPTAEAEYALGVWCDEHNLKDLAWVHYDLAVKRDSTFSPAHRKLGHVLMNGRWLNSEEVKEAQGLVKYQGRWMSPEERDRREALASKAAEGSSWSRRIKTLRDGYLSPQRAKSEEAERRLLAIDEPAAIGPVLKILGEDPLPAVRAMASRVLSGIPGAEAANGLVGRFLIEEDEGVRQVTMNELARRDPSEIVPLLTRSLRSSHHQVVNRSAWGLGNLNAVSVVPKLIPVLVTVEQEVVMVDTTPVSTAPTAPPGYIQGGGIGVSGRSIPIVTPTVGPGVAAYGASSVPLNSFGTSPFSLGSGGSTGPVPKLVPIEYRNDEVLNALVKLTGQNFGYEMNTWKQWLASSFKIETAPTRRVREP